MSDWGIVVPKAVMNLCDNPSFELGTTGWTTGGTNVLTASNEQSKLGGYSGKCIYSNFTNLFDYPVTLPSASVTYAISAWVYIPTGTTVDYTVQMHADNFAGIAVPTQYVRWIDGVDAFDTWKRIWATLTLSADTTGNIYIVTTTGAPGGTKTFYVDGVQFEQVSEVSDYVDGDQPGCSWSGTPHASTSSRSAVSRAGGVVKDLKDDYGLGVSDIIGAGAAPLTVGVKGYSFLPGGAVTGIKVNPRQFSLVGTLKGNGVDCDLHAARQSLAKELAHNRYPQDDEGWQPVRIRYTGATVEKEIAARYAGGLEAGIKLEDRIHEKVALRMVADDPMWYGLGENSEALDSEDTLAVRYIASRLRSTGLWDNLSVGAGGSTVYDIKVDTDNTLLACGGWTTIDGVANTSRIARYSPVTNAWTALNKGATDGFINAMTWAPDGSLYVGGSFTSMDNGTGPVANTSRIAKWDGNNWLALGTGANGSVQALAVGHDGTLYAGGSFTAIGGAASTNCIAMWDGTNWSSISSGITGGLPTVYALAIHSNGALLAGGDFTVLDGVTVNRIASYWPPTTTWYALESGAVTGNVQVIYIPDYGSGIYVGGSFTQMGAALAAKIAYWQGTSWETLGGGINNSVLAIAGTPGGIVYVGGAFTEVGGLATPGRMAKWNGLSWGHLDIILPVNIVHSLTVANIDSATDNYDLHVGMSTSGNAIIAGTATVTNAGSTVGYPRIIVKRTGGTSAILMTVRNETSGAQLLFDYSLLDGETLTIDLTPTQKSVVSSFFGDRMDAILTGSDFGTFCLLPGDNDITCFVAESGSPTVTTTMVWRDTYLSFD